MKYYGKTKAIVEGRARKPVREYLLKQGRFAHFTEEDLGYFQAKVDEMWDKWEIPAVVPFQRLDASRGRAERRSSRRRGAGDRAAVTSRRGRAAERRPAPTCFIAHRLVAVRRQSMRLLRLVSALLIGVVLLAAPLRPWPGSRPSRSSSSSRPAPAAAPTRWPA